MATGSNKAIIAAFLANLGIAVSKLVGFFLTGASSMLAEAVHSMADSGNQGLLLLGMSRAKQDESPERSTTSAARVLDWSHRRLSVPLELNGARQRRKSMQLGRLR